MTASNEEILLQSHHHAVYNSENGKWYRPETSFAVRVVLGRGEKLPPDPGVKADTYIAAFEAIYGQTHIFPAPVRSARRESVLL